MALKHYNITEWIDMETGEMLTLSKVKRNYIKIKYNEKNKKNEYGDIIHTRTWECKRHPQLRLEF